MVELKQLPKLEAANTFRHGLFQCFFETDTYIRADAMKTLSHVVEFWTHSWLEFQHKTSLSLRPTRPSIVRQLSSGSGTLSTPGYLMRRDSSFKMQFDDLFGIDGDDVFGNTGTLRRKDSAAGAVPLLSDTEEAGWTSLTGEFAISSSDTSGPFTNPDFKFSNWGIGTINTTIEDINWIGKVVVEEIWGSDEMKVNLDSYYIWLLRFSFDCPFRDVRKGCKNILLRAEKLGAELPVVPHVGPSIFVPLCDTVGLDYPDQELTPVNPGGNSHSLPGTPSDEDEEGVSISPKDNFPAGIMIPETKGAIYGERQRPRSIAKMPADSSIGGSNRRPPVSLVSTLFQTPPSPSSAMLPSHKFKRRANICRPAPKYLPKAKEPNENMRSLQLQTYTRTGRVGNFSQVLFNFPRFSRLCRQVTDLFLSSDSVAGPLPQTWRIYLGIIAAAEMRCQYYISLLSEKFLTVQGSPEWLEGIRYAPAKLQRITKLNKSLAHIPWTITADDISRLVRIDDMWSVSEVMQAILVLSFYHGKSAMALAWGILPEADLLGGTVIGAPVAPFIAPSASLSTDPSSELLPSARTISDIGSLGMQGIDKGSIGLLGRKRASDIQEDKQNNILPEKWRKTPVGSVPYSPTPISPIGTTISADVSALSPKFFESLTTDSNRPKRGRAKSVKRRKSFDECGTTDEPVTPHSVTSLSSSAPSLDSYILHSAISGAKPFSMLKDYVLSPSSSTSSIFDAASLEDFPQAPVNVMTDDYTKFICSELKAELLDPNREGYEVLPMEEFDWDRNATCIIGSYLESYVDLLDEYFKEAMDAELENDGLCTSDAGSEQPKKSKQDPFVPSPGDITDRDSSDVSHDFESQGRSSSMHSQWGSTRSIKDAAWYYSLRSLNIYDDDFRYSDIKRHLDKGTRKYIKRVCVRPDLVTAADWLGVQTMKNEEKCRIGLLSCQARFLGEALWGIKGVSNFLC